MRIIPAKFQPSRTNGVGGDRGDRRTRDVTHSPANAKLILPPPSLRSGGITKILVQEQICLIALLHRILQTLFDNFFPYLPLHKYWTLERNWEKRDPSNNKIKNFVPFTIDGLVENLKLNEKEK